jgi:MYXO-CTERM domain-containing protein
MGRGVNFDPMGNVWVAAYQAGTIKKFDGKGTLIGEYPLSRGSGMAVSIDIDLRIVTVNSGAPVADRFQLDGKRIASYSIAGTPANNAKYNFEAYIYSDMTGHQAARLSKYAHDGEFRAVFDGGYAGVPWQRMRWNTEAQGAVPAGSTLSGTIRAADDKAALAKAPWKNASSGTLLMGVVGRFVEVRLEFLSDGNGTPVLSDVSIEGPCPKGLGETCCIGDGDCDDKNACTKDTCGGVGKACAHAAVMGCCNADGDCDDKDPCTTDKCSGPGGTCQMPAPIMGCCKVDADCDDKNACTKDTCPMAGGMCAQAKIMGCCNAAGDCDDMNACTSDKCSGPGGMCASTPIMGCCKVDADCDDKNPCTTDTCGMGGVCGNAPVMGCCAKDEDCGAGKRCEMNACVDAPDLGGGGDLAMAGGADLATAPRPDLSSGTGADLAKAMSPGEGGCSCHVGARGSSPASALLAFALLALLLFRRRRA